MDHNILLQLRYFKIHLTIPINYRCSHLPKSPILFYLSKNKIPLEINGVRIPPNKSATILFRFLRSAQATGKSVIVFISMDHICIGDGLSTEVCIKGVFRQWVRWGLESETIKFMMETKICVVTDQRFLTREKMGSRIDRFYPKLTSILEDDDKDDDDDEEDVKQVMNGSNDSDCAKQKQRER